MLDTLFLLTIGIGYLFALTHLYYIQVSDQVKVKAFSYILRGFGYEMIPEGNGWLVKESLRSWQFLHSIDEMEAYVKEVQDRHQGD